MSSHRSDTNAQPKPLTASVDSAMTGGSQRSTLAVLAFANFVVGMGAFVVVGTLSPVATAFAIGKAETGWLMTIYAIVYAISSPLLVALTGDVRRARVLLGGMVLFCAGSVAAAAAPSFGALLAARALMALGGGLITPVAASVGVLLVPLAHRGRALAIIFGGLTLAQVLGVPAGAWLAYAYGWRIVFEVVAVLALLGCAALYNAVPRAIVAPRTGLDTLGKVLTTPRLVCAIAFTALFVGGLYVPYTYLAAFLEAQYGLGRDGVTTMLLVFGGGAVVGNALGGILTDRVGPQRTLTILCLAQLVAMPLLTELSMPLIAVGVAIALWSIFGWSFMVPQQARLASLAPDRVPVVFSLNAAAIYIGASVGPLLGGETLKRGGLALLGPAGAALIALALLTLIAVWRTPRA